MDPGDSKMIAALDIGTTTVRCQLINKAGEVVSTDTRRLEILQPQRGYSEIDPDSLWDAVTLVIFGAVSKSLVSFEQIQCLGISCQRCTFITWNTLTGKPYHNFITWKDLRASKIVEEFNTSWKLQSINLASKLLYILTRCDIFLAGSAIKLSNPQVPPRLMWVLDNVPEVRKDVKKGVVSFGTIDTWLIHKFTNGSVYVTEYSNASATGIFDPFKLSWSSLMLKLTGIPAEILPPVLDTGGSHFGSVSVDIFGHEIPIRCVISDQSASLFGLCCFEEGDAKITMGTGSFLNVNTGASVHLSSEGVLGMYPVVAWKRGNEVTYAAEQASNDTGTIVDWASSLGLCNDVNETSALASSVADSKGVYFVPAFSGLQAPINDPWAGTGFIGIKPTTDKAHMIRSMLESIAFRMSQMVGVFKANSARIKSTIRVDGGVSQNDFILQFLANLTDINLERLTTCETSALGAAYFAGLADGFWDSKEELKRTVRIQKTFSPNEEGSNQAKSGYSSWMRAVDRFKGWEWN